MPKITVLGPMGATFSHDAYNLLVEIFSGPETILEGEAANCVPASDNGQILKLIVEHGGYGAIAMETLARGRVEVPLTSFIQLLDEYNNQTCPIQVIGAIKLCIHFCLMVQPSNAENPNLTGIVAHPKAFDPCRVRIATSDLPVVEASSNGEAARLVAEDDKYANYAALGPESAAKKYGLTILDPVYEDQKAITTFFLIGPAREESVEGEENRVLIVFRLEQRPGALVDALDPFRQENLNLIQVYSIGKSNGVYDFAIEVEVGQIDLPNLGRAMESFEIAVEKYISFGPFAVVSR